MNNDTIAPPILLPSFSSRALRCSRAALKTRSRDLFIKYAPEMDKLLISAFDLRYGYIEIADIPIGSVIVVDSGGYEVRSEHDDSAIYQKPFFGMDEPWSERIFLETLSTLPDESRFVFVSFDNDDHVGAQIHRAIAQMLRFRNAKRTFLLKPNRHPIGGMSLGSSDFFSSTLTELQSHVSELSFFDIIGVTEKDLGESYAERLTNIAFLKQILSRVEKILPIHVFGSLDPLSVRLYFAAGADIFDGLTWLRFAYSNNSCTYINHAILDGTIDLNENIDESAEALFSRNCVMLSALKDALAQFRITGDWTVLGIESNLAEKVKRVLAAANDTNHRKEF
jgi:hypothetical protein